MKKPNLQSPLDRLDDAKQHEVFELLKGTSYADALPRLRKEYGVRTSEAALSRFVKRRSVAESLRTSLYVADAFADDEDVKALDRKSRAAVTTALWEAISNRDKESIVAFGKLALGFSADERAAKELALAREKFEATERRLAAAKTAVADQKLTPAEREAKLKEIFGI